VESRAALLAKLEAARSDVLLLLAETVNRLSGARGALWVAAQTGREADATLVEMVEMLEAEEARMRATLSQIDTRLGTPSRPPT